MVVYCGIKTPIRMAPAIIGRLFGRVVPADVVEPASLGPLAARAVLTAHNLVRRDDDNRPDPSRGVVDPHNINNTVMFVLFGLIGASFVVLGIWFFFWARNGGFYFKENDWDDYKTTVMRRRGPNGTILSNATPSTNLGGGSIYKDVDDGTTVSASTRYRDGRNHRHNDDDDNRTDITSSSYMTGITAGVSNIGARDARRKKKEARDRERERRREEKAMAKAEKKAVERGEGKSASRKVGADGALIDEEAEELAKEQLRSYRHERPARVGGINKESDASTWDGSTNPSASSAGARSERTEASELLGDRQRTPTSTPTKKSGGIRKVYSTADKVANREAEREAERVRAEARRLQEKGRAHMSAVSSAAGSGSGSAAAAPRRDFSFQRGHVDDRDQFAMRRIEENDEDRHRHHVPGSYVGSDYTGSEVGTKAYHHPIPELAPSSLSGNGVQTQDFGYQDDKRRQRRGGGYRRGQ